MFLLEGYMNGELSTFDDAYDDNDDVDGNNTVIKMMMITTCYLMFSSP